MLYQSKTGTKSGSHVPVYCRNGLLKFSCLEHARISFFMPTLLWSHDMKGSGSSTDRKKNNRGEEKPGNSCELSSMNWLTAGPERHCCKGGESGRIASFQAAGQQIRPATALSGGSLGFPCISSGNHTGREQARLAHISSWKLPYPEVNFQLHQQAHLIIPVSTWTLEVTQRRREEHTIRTVFFSPVIPA